MIPIVVSFRRDGIPVTEVGDLEPATCNHAGETWSSDLSMRCTQCGVRLFASPEVLAYRSAAVVEQMYKMWQAAGWPHLYVPLFGRVMWITDNWELIQHPLFAHIGGLSVRRDKLDAFRQMEY